jgi:hypothetical protein
MSIGDVGVRISREAENDWIVAREAETVGRDGAQPGQIQGPAPTTSEEETVMFSAAATTDAAAELEDEIEGIRGHAEQLLNDLGVLRTLLHDPAQFLESARHHAHMVAMHAADLPRLTQPARNKANELLETLIKTSSDDLAIA